MVEQEAQRLADLICGCATREQNRKDVAEIKAALIAAEARGMEKAAKIVEHAWFTCAIDVIMDADAAQALCETTAAAIRAALGGQHE